MQTTGLTLKEALQQAQATKCKIRRAGMTGWYTARNNDLYLDDSNVIVKIFAEDAIAEDWETDETPIPTQMYTFKEAAEHSYTHHVMMIRQFYLNTPDATILRSRKVNDMSPLQWIVERLVFIRGEFIACGHFSPDSLDATDWVEYPFPEQQPSGESKPTGRVAAKCLSAKGNLMRIGGFRYRVISSTFMYEGQLFAPGSVVRSTDPSLHERCKCLECWDP